MIANSPAAAEDLATLKSRIALTLLIVNFLYRIKPMRRPHRHNCLFRAACEGLKLLAFMVAGFVSVCLFLAVFGAFEQVETFVEAVMLFYLRLTAALVSLMAIAGLLESLE